MHPNHFRLIIKVLSKASKLRKNVIVDPSHAHLPNKNVGFFVYPLKRQNENMDDDREEGGTNA